MSIAIGALILLVFVVRAFAPGVIPFAAMPFWKTGDALTAGAGNAGTFFADKGALLREVAALRSENESLRAQQAILEARAADFERLLGTRTERAPGILAGVLTRPPVSPYDVLVIDAGQSSGVVSGMRAFGAGGVPLGVVESAANQSARVVLYSAPGHDTQAWVGETRIPVTLSGRGAGAFSLEAARESGIMVGDTVFVPGSGALPIGTVVSVGNDPSSPRSRVEVKPVLNPFSVTWVTLTP